MAITFTKQPTGIYPGYNNSFVEFASNILGDFKAEITVYPVATFPKVLLIYPDSDGNYLFNLKEFVKVQLNENGFIDANFFTDAWFKSISGLYLSQDIDILVTGDEGTDTISKTYEFFKAVKQISEPQINEPYQLLTYTPDGQNHKLTYFEGFPFQFDMQRIVFTGANVVQVKNTTHTDTSVNMAVTASGAFRFLVDKGTINWNTDGFLTLENGINNLEIYIDTVKQTDLQLTKKQICGGVYLKWFNSNGGFSHFLFSRFYNESNTGNDIDSISKNEFENIYDAIGKTNSIGKSGTRSLITKTKYNADEFEVLKDLFISPYVQVYTSTVAGVAGSFIDCSVNGGFTHNKKRAINELTVTIDLPELETARL